MFTMNDIELNQQGNTSIPTFGNWIWLAAALTVFGDLIIAVTVILNAASIFDYNGPNPGPSKLSAIEGFIIFEFLAVAVAVGVCLAKAWGARRLGSLRWYHFVPILIAASSLVFAIFVLVTAISDMLG